MHINSYFAVHNMENPELKTMFSLQTHNAKRRERKWLRFFRQYLQWYFYMLVHSLSTSVKCNAYNRIVRTMESEQRNLLPHILQLEPNNMYLVCSSFSLSFLLAVCVCFIVCLNTNFVLFLSVFSFRSFS